ncbi:MAG: hypothetical protein WC736_10500 [Gallionella sp.]
MDDSSQKADFISLADSALNGSALRYLSRGRSGRNIDTFMQINIMAHP